MTAQESEAQAAPMTAQESEAQAAPMTAQESAPPIGRRRRMRELQQAVAEEARRTKDAARKAAAPRS